MEEFNENFKGNAPNKARGTIILVGVICLVILIMGGFFLINSNKSSLNFSEDSISIEQIKDNAFIDGTKDTIIGYEFIDGGDVVYIWNNATISDYFFEKDAGIQLTNHYNDYWTKNVFCIGYYNNGEWNKIKCADELTNFNKEIDSDYETFVNATLWKDIEYGAYDLRLGVNYYLGLNDENLSITIYGKNIGDDIPFDLGFAWKVEDINIPLDSTDSILINDTTYNLDESLDLTFNDLYEWRNVSTKVVDDYTYEMVKVPLPFYKIFDEDQGTIGGEEFLRISWNENLNYEVNLYSNGNQESSYATILIDAGHFNAGQEKSTTFYWIDLLTDNLLAYWKMDEASGNIADSAESVTGTAGGSPVYGKTGIIGDAIYFSGNDWFQINGLASTSTSYTYQYWINSSKSGYGIATILTDTEFGRLIIRLEDEGDKFGFYESEIKSISSNAAILDGTFHHVILTLDGTTQEAKLYYDGVYIDNQTYEDRNLGGRSAIGANYAQTASWISATTLDELAIWERVLTSIEVSQLYNGGAGLAYPLPTPADVQVLTVTLNTPTNDSHTSNPIMVFNASYSYTLLNTTNATYYIYNSTGTFNKTTVTLTPASNSSKLNVTGFSTGNYDWNVYGCGENGTGGVVCNWSSVGNYTFEWIPFSIDSETHLDSSVETNRETFKINITSTSGYTIGNARLVYNGTNYENADKVQIDSDSYALTRTIYIPPANLNANFNTTKVTFYWNISVINELTGATAYSTTSDYNQTVHELKFQKCSTNVNITLVNFTLYDEATLSRINASANTTSFQASFNFGAYSENKAKNYSYGNLSSDNSSFTFCTKNSSRTIYVDMVSIISATGYAERNYYLSNSTLTNATSEIQIYLIPEDDALEFFISVTQGLKAVTGASVQVAKFFVGEGIYKTIEIDETDSNGEFNIYLDLDRDYQATIIKDGAVLGVKTFKSSCSSAPCEITIEIEGEIIDLFDNINSLYAENVRYNLSYDSATEIVTFQFVDITGLANYFRMAVYNSNSSEDATLISNQTLYTSSGSMSFDISGYDGQFIAEVFVSRSPELLIDFLRFMLSSFYDEMGDYAGVALLLGFLLILTFIFGLAFKPAILMLAIPIIIHLGTIAGLFPTSGIVITIFYVFAILGVVAIGKGS